MNERHMNEKHKKGIRMKDTRKKYTSMGSWRTVTEQGGESGLDHGRNQVCQRAPPRRVLAYAEEEA